MFDLVNLEKLIVSVNLTVNSINEQPELQPQRVPSAILSQPYGALNATDTKR